MRTGLVGILVLGWIGAADAQAPLLPASPAASPATTDMAVGATRTEMQELVEAARATAKTTREGVDYSRVVPDLLTQILAKLDKIENKLDKIETARSGARKPAR